MLELELRRCRHTGGLQQYVGTVTSHLVISAGNIRRSHGRDQRGKHGGQRDWSRPIIGYSKPVFHSSQITSTRTKCRSWGLTSASNLPRGRRKDSEARPPHQWPRKSSTTELYPEGSQFADNVNSHPASLSHGDSHQDPDRQRGEGKIPGPHRLASQVMNHRTISRRLPVVKNSTVSDDSPVTREVE